MSHRIPLTEEVIAKATIKRPYYRTVRQLLSGDYMVNGFSAYVKDPKYAQGVENDIRSFLIIQKDFIEILEYIEPADANNDAYSLQLRNLLIRICTEVEANLKAILIANSYSREGVDADSWSMTDYCKVNKSHFLSDYKIYLPHWDGEKGRQPFKSWGESNKLTWYQAYNNSKHDRGSMLMEANLKNVVDAMTGLVALLSAQFYTIEFNGPSFRIASMGNDVEHAIGDYFSVEFPDIPIEERYHLDINYTKNVEHIYDSFDYSKA
jgi:hypothetical protein